MKQFTYSGVLTCPSDWTEEQTKKYIKEQLLSTREEKDALVVKESTK